jgi:hypothetical protein
MAPASVNRCTTVMKAALNLTAAGDETISNRQAWVNGLKAIPNAEKSRNVIRRRLVEACSYGKGKNNAGTTACIIAIVLNRTRG